MYSRLNIFKFMFFCKEVSNLSQMILELQKETVALIKILHRWCTTNTRHINRSDDLT
jgi:hypothetical protein